MNNPSTPNYNQSTGQVNVQTLIEQDLAKSGLVIDDVNARPMSSPEKAATSVSFSIQGYVLPYYTLYGKPAGHYRVKLFDNDVKYKQPKDSMNHLYFPKNFLQVAEKEEYILLTEGEKKAAALTKFGYPCVGVGGVDSWRNKIITIPSDAELKSNDKSITAKLPAGGQSEEDFNSPLAVGMQDLIDYLLVKEKKLIIVYDTDNVKKTNTSVQRAAATLGFELRFRGIAFNMIRQIHLPPIEGEDKVGVDDYYLMEGKSAFDKLLLECLAKKSAFPRHPNIRDFLNKRLQKTKMSRKETQAISIAVLSELDNRGIRLRSEEEAQSYYFDIKTHKLLKVQFNGTPNEFTENVFGHFMYRSFGLGAADQKVIQWIGTHFTGEEPVENVTPYRVFAREKLNADCVIMQLGDGEYAYVDKDGLRIKSNGTDNILFESEQVVAVDTKLLVEEYKKQISLPVSSWWMQVLQEVRLKDKDRQRVITALLFYIAPWLYRWRGMQLPIEMTLGEAGSGKSTLQELRLLMQTGTPRLRNSPQDIKDWHASVSNAGGLHVTDNVQLLDKNLRQRLSDEICRIITETDPSIEMRKYYTNAEVIRFPVRCVFGITAITQPFLNSDILQRSVIIELDKAQDIIDGTVSYDMAWKEQQLSRFGGREAWLAHHFIVLTRFFQLVSQKWNMKYRAKHRLINFEQSIMLMAEIFGIGNQWIPDYLMGATDAAVTDADWAFQGLKEFSLYWSMDPRRIKTPFTVQEIANWAMGSEEYEKCDMLVNTRRLGKYIKTHKSMVASTCNIYEAGSANNRQTYRIGSGK